MITVAHVISRIAQLEAEYANVALMQPSGKEAFDYGRACGRMQGFAKVKEEIQRMIEEDAKNEQLRESD